jgi:hypothetical protein
MAVREFTDRTGRKWRAWEVKPEEIHPATKSEDYLADCYITGWIVFETISSDEKRRLCPWPVDWVTRTEAQLRDLLAAAEVVPAQRRTGEGAIAAEAMRRPTEQGDLSHTPSDLDVTDLSIVRAFKYPGGRVWTVGVVLDPEDGDRPVLRFAAGLRHIDVTSWPKDWADEPDEALAEMLRRASPRQISGATGRGIPRRRWDDQAEAT